MQRGLRVKEQAEKKHEEKKLKEDERMLTYVNKINKLQKTRAEATKMMHMNIKMRDVPDHKERLAEIKEKKEEQAKLQARKIKMSIKNREKQVERNMSYLNEENERRKEVKNLHKLDQEDTLQRKLAFEKMGLENRVQMILEKASRVPRPAI